MPLSKQATDFMAQSTGVNPALSLSDRLTAMQDESPAEVAADPPKVKTKKPGKAQVAVETEANTP